ncbi:MAG: hypothetical protein ACLVKO_11125 [Dysgonomonas sp.]
MISQENEEFKPSGRIIARGFFDFSTDFDKETGFDITRAFLGYEYDITKNLSAQVVVDGAAGTDKDHRLEIYVRNAFLNWNDKNFNINVGLIGLLQFSTQEDYWAHRYVLRSFQDLNKMAPSVDLGFTVEHKFSDLISADVSFTNGTGYKDVRKTGSKRYAGGLNVHPFKNALFRVYGDIYNDSKELRDELPENVLIADFKNQYTLSLFAGYQNDLFSFGGEYNRVFNKGFIEDKDFYGVSFYATVNFLPKWNAYVRYDLADSAMPSTFIEQWSDLDGQLVMGGVEFRPLKQLKISPNFRNINPDRGESEQYLFVNLEFNL